MVYSKISIDRVLSVHPGLSIGDMMVLAVREHALTNGCTFEADAAARAIQMVGLNSADWADDLSEDVRVKLAIALEAMEIDCAHKGDADKREAIMKRWDAWRKHIAEGGVASWPRDEFEALIDGYEEECAELRSALTGMEAKLKAFGVPVDGDGKPTQPYLNCPKCGVVMKAMLVEKDTE